jgi:hypothetical protein
MVVGAVELDRRWNRFTQALVHAAAKEQNFNLE